MPLFEARRNGPRFVVDITVRGFRVERESSAPEYILADQISTHNHRRPRINIERRHIRRERYEYGHHAAVLDPVHDPVYRMNLPGIDGVHDFNRSGRTGFPRATCIRAADIREGALVHPPKSIRRRPIFWRGVLAGAGPASLKVARHPA